MLPGPIHNGILGQENYFSRVKLFRWDIRAITQSQELPPTATSLLPNSGESYPQQPCNPATKLMVVFPTSVGTCSSGHSHKGVFSRFSSWLGGFLILRRVPRVVVEPAGWHPWIVPSGPPVKCGLCGTRFQIPHAGRRCRPSSPALSRLGELAGTPLLALLSSNNDI